jgi:hypothetical protein
VFPKIILCVCRHPWLKIFSLDNRFSKKYLSPSLVDLRILEKIFSWEPHISNVGVAICGWPVDLRFLKKIFSPENWFSKKYVSPSLVDLRILEKIFSREAHISNVGVAIRGWLVDLWFLEKIISLENRLSKKHVSPSLVDLRILEKIFSWEAQISNVGVTILGWLVDLRFLEKIFFLENWFSKKYVSTSLVDLSILKKIFSWEAQISNVGVVDTS